MLRTTRSLTLALLAAGMLVACGGGGEDGDGVASMSDDSEGESAQDDANATEEELLEWVECMRDNGADIPDPTVDENGDLVIEGPVTVTNGGPGEGEDEGAPGDDSSEGSEGSVVREDVFEECGQPPEGAFAPPSEEEQQAMQDAALEFAECMRSEGIEDFPDPDFSDMGPGAEPRQRTDEDESGSTDGGGDDGGPTVVLGPFGEIDMSDPETAAAFEACQDIMEEARPGGGQGAPAGGGANGDSQG
jgi:hypothetical protein